MNSPTRDAETPPADRGPRLDSQKTNVLPDKNLFPTLSMNSTPYPPDPIRSDAGIDADAGVGADVGVDVGVGAASGQPRLRTHSRRRARRARFAAWRRNFAGRRYIPSALFVFVVSALIILISVLALTRSRGGILIRYETAGQAKLRGPTPGDAVLFYRRLIHANPQRARYWIGLARALETASGGRATDAVLKRLVPAPNLLALLRTPTTGNAANATEGGVAMSEEETLSVWLWEAQRCLRRGIAAERIGIGNGSETGTRTDGASASTSASALAAATGWWEKGASYSRAVWKKRGGGGAAALHGELSARLGRWSEARTALLPVGTTHPASRLWLYRVEERLGLTEEMRKSAQAAQRHFQTRCEANPGDDLARQHWAEATVALNDFPTAVTILQRGLPDPRFRTLLAKVYADWYARQPLTTAEGLVTAVALLDQALAAAPTDPLLLNQLRALIPGQPSLPPQAVVWYREQLGRGVGGNRGAALLHLLIGLDHWLANREGPARIHWNQAYQHRGPLAPAIVGNLAWSIAAAVPPPPRLNADADPDPKHAEAIRLALRILAYAESPLPSPSPFDKTVERTNEEQRIPLRLRGIRGRILARDQRWREALTELVAAESAFTNDSGYYDIRAQAHDASGEPDAAETCRQRAIALRTAATRKGIEDSPYEGGMLGVRP